MQVRKNSARVLKRAQRCTFTGSEADGTFFEMHIT
jgi:hypothetical protein